MQKLWLTVLLGAKVEMLKIYFRSVCSKDNKATIRLMVSEKRTLLDRNSRLAFKFKRETAQTWKIYLVHVRDRGDKTVIIQTMANVKQTLLDSKSRVAFEFKREDLVQKLQVGNYCILLQQLLVHNATVVTRHGCIGGWVTRLYPSCPQSCQHECTQIRLDNFML